MLSAFWYYLLSIPTLLAGVRNWDGILRLCLRPSGSSTVVVRLRNGCRFTVRTLMDLWIIKETCLDREYEKGLPAVPEDGTAFDVGAGLGDFAIRMAWKHPRRKIIAFEPFAESFRMLEENLSLNGIENVRCFSYAIGAQSGPMVLQTATAEPVQHSTASPGKTPSRPALQVSGLSLDDAFRAAQVDRCHLLKVDCEGGEYDLFFGASKETLARIGCISMEYHDCVTQYSHADLKTFLEQRGFSVRLRQNPVHSRLGFLTAIRPS
jgi:FkbM family methyltransferase